MNISIAKRDYDEVMAVPPRKHQKPVKPHIFFRFLLKMVSLGRVKKTKATWTEVGMEKLGKKEPAFFLMQHSGFFDMQLATYMLFPRAVNIVATADSFVGRPWLMRLIGCIPTNKFVLELSLIKDMLYCVKKLKSSVLMYPEAGYTFDGRALPIPETLGKMAKMMGVPLCMISTKGVYHYEPVYDGQYASHNRKVPISAEIKYLLSKEQIEEMTPEEIQAVIEKEFQFDNFAWQRDNKIKVDEPFRACGLNRILYKCPTCLSEGKMIAEGTTITCPDCGKTYHLDEYGVLSATDGVTEFSHIPDWYAWERKCVREEIERGEYSFDYPVDIIMMANDYKFARVGTGHLHHDVNGFVLDGCDGRLHYEHKALSSYSINCDLYFYQLPGVVSFGNKDRFYYCYPPADKDVLCKLRFAYEESYKIKIAEKKKPHAEKAEAKG